ncbi:MAG: glycerophosphodiester phosphodiesterase family protein [Actinobacteria bacterium]|nr:glycerophosphodiester phosphodiesterase family protein [Actinomycetota bacterium]
MRPKIFAHRGASDDFAEQSYESYTGAISQNADGFECDVQLTSDNEIICWHDDDTNRLTDKQWLIAKTPMKEILKLEIKDEGNTGRPITFSELLQISIDSGRDLLVETKHPVPTRGLIEKKVLAELKKRKQDIKKSGININIMSFSYFATRRVALTRKFTPVFLVAQAPLIKYVPAEIYGVHIKLLIKKPELIDILHKREKKIYVWTVNEPEDMEFCARNGVAGIITDNPARAKNVLGYS